MCGWVCAAGLVAMAWLVAGCGEGEAEGGVVEDKRGEPTASDPPSVARGAAVAAYLSMWEDVALASHTSDSDHPRLDDHASGQALELVRTIMQGHAEDGHVAKGGPQHEVEVVESAVGRREVRDCMDSRDWLMHKADGGLVDDVPGSHRMVEATVEKDGRWLVTQLTLHQVGTC